MDWFKEEWLQEDHKALGVYLALLRARFRYTLYYKSKDEALQGFDFNKLREQLSVRLRGKELIEAFNTAKEFIELLYEHEKDALKADRRAEILDELEGKYYEKFKEVYIKYVDKDLIKKYIEEGKIS